jgi:5-methyltetrahydropteroyltriglutamate--homocysteine methyltransferase
MDVLTLFSRDKLPDMKTEPIGSIPRPLFLIQTIAAFQSGEIGREVLDDAYANALRDTIDRFEQTGSPVITDGEQTKPSFVTYPLSGLDNLAPDGVTIPFADGHVRQLPRLTAGPFHYGVHAAGFLSAARSYTKTPVKQAVISASALSLLYPSSEIPNYPREAFIADLINEAETDIRGALDAGATSVQIDFTEARLSLKLDLPALCCVASSTSTIKFLIALLPRSGNSSAFMSALEATRIPRTAPMSITQLYYPISSN